MSDKKTTNTKTLGGDSTWNFGCALMVVAVCAMLSFMVHSCNEYKTLKLHACESECSCSKQIEENP